jgi:PhnB protein
MQTQSQPTGANASQMNVNPIYDTYKPPGFHTITSYMMVEDAFALIAFLKEAFDAVELYRVMDKDKIRNATLQIGDSCFMLSHSSKEDATKAHYLLYVADPDAMYDRAMANGAVSVLPVEDHPYHDRSGGVKDCAGNVWWIGKRLKEEQYKA